MDKPTRSRAKTATSLVLGVALTTLLFVGCASPRLFSFQNINYFIASSGQAQLGNLGLMTSTDGLGFQRVGFLSDCQNTTVPVSIDATMHGLLPIQNAFGAGTKAKELSALLGVPRDDLEKSSVLLFSVNPLDAQQQVASWPDACRNLVARNPGRARMVISVAVLLPHRILAPEATSSRLTAEVAPRGYLKLTVHGRKSVELSVPPQAVFAWRSGHFCWPEEGDGGPVLRADDPGFATCPEQYDDSAQPGSPWSVEPEKPVYIPKGDDDD